MKIIQFFSVLSLLLVAVLHVGFLVLEMFLWEQPIGLRIFSMSQEQAQVSAVLAKNQGLYNGFLAAGIVWGLVNNRFDVKVLYLIFVTIAGIYGALTVGMTVFYVQAMPAMLALGLILWHRHHASPKRD